MINDRVISISAANNRYAKVWSKQTLLWSEMVERLRTPARSSETLESYQKKQQDDLKDVGGYVAGTLANGHRKAGAVTGRDVITLDLDNIDPWQTDDVVRRVTALGCGYALYSTRKHCDAKPRLRVLMPLNRTVNADEYEPIARKVASYIDINLCDPTTFQALRLMYWPSCCSDSQYVFTYEDKPFIDADGILAQYDDWQDMTQWPEVPGAQKTVKRMAAKQGDPRSKKGVVGAFCQIYNVVSAMDAFLLGEYRQCGNATDRYTFVAGSTTGGAVIYDDGAFIYSHHATDPAGGRLCNAFDLVRLHLYGDLDDGAEVDTPTNRLPSYTAMCHTALADTNVTTLLSKVRYDKAVTDFGAPPSDAEDLGEWMSLLSLSDTGMPKKTIDSVLIILEHDPLLKGKIAFDEFSNRGLVLGSLPWNSTTERRQWTDVDDAGLRHYIEKTQGITGKERIFDAAALAAHKTVINDVKDYILSLKWDGIKRLDTLLPDYLGSENTVYTRAVMRTSLAAAVARVLNPGVKYDYMPIFTGPQGIGKSTFLRLLGLRWYSDSLTSFDGKEAAEMIQGVWINEVGELNGLTKSETNSVKQFLSKTNDIYREPYGRRTGTYPRRCVFFGTTNDEEFLRDRTGNRRFWPVKVGVREPIKNIFTELETEVDQIWAEAVVAWELGQPLYLQGEAEEAAKIAQEEHRETSAKEGLIKEFLAREIHPDWQRWDIQQHQMFWGNPNKPQGLIQRDRVCAGEIWVECLGGNLRFMKRTDTVEINGILSSLPGWEYAGNQRFGSYGTQKGFKCCQPSTKV
ncbi:MAG: virulence-associated E family protein, partial [Clostridiales bacterium]